MKLDGNYGVVGGLSAGTMYPVYRTYFDTRKLVASPLNIRLSVAYDSSSRQGGLTILIQNTTGSAISGQLQVVLVERSIYYPWQGLDSLYDVERAMLPDANGEAVTIPANDSITKMRNFTLNTGWVDHKCDLIAFVQNNSTKEIYQGARTAIRPMPRLTYLSYEPVLPVPGADADLAIHLRNAGTGDAENVSATLSTNDPNITILTPTASYGAIPRGQERAPQTPFQIRVNGSCPDPHLAMLNLTITAAYGYLTTTSFPLNITTTTGFVDNMENGTNNWTHSGTNDQWHQSTYRSVSPTHSWYSGNDANHQYSNENDARLMTPYFTFGAGATLGFQHWYATEQNYDYCIVEVNNGSEFWTPIASFTGSSSGWRAQSYPLDVYADQTVRVRFRFLSDYNVTAEGWYIDDFNAGVTTGIREQRSYLKPQLFATRNPVQGYAEINYRFPSGSSGTVDIYDAEGRLVRGLGSKLTGNGQLRWNLTDGKGLAVQEGVYFARLVSESGQQALKLTVVR